MRAARELLFFSVCGLFLYLYSGLAFAVASDVLSGCARVPAAAKGRAFYVDPNRGSMQNDGSNRAPWSTLHDVIAKGLIADKVFKQPYKLGGELLPNNPTGVIHPGDVIYLRSGDHGDVTLRGVNDKFITIEAESGQTPVISHLVTVAASKWILRGITFRSDKGGWLVEFISHGWQGPSENIVFERNELFSTPDANGWSVQDWLSRAMSGISSSATCATIRNNQLANVRHGIKVMGANTLVDGNVIDHFADDGIDVLAGNVSIVKNRITNNHGLGDGNHNDGIQGWTVKGAVNDNVLIANNLIAHSTVSSLPLPGELQGISIFDGRWTNLRILNNRVVTNHWHGIAVFGARNSIIEGNTVTGTDPKRLTWIMVGNRKATQGGEPPRNVLVRNNVAMQFKLPNDSSQVLSEGNKCPKLVTPHDCGLY
jgi:parallel beta-helix repeat protein